MPQKDVTLFNSAKEFNPSLSRKVTG